MEVLKLHRFVKDNMKGITEQMEPLTFWLWFYSAITEIISNSTYEDDWNNG